MESLDIYLGFLFMFFLIFVLEKKILREVFI